MQFCSVLLSILPIPKEQCTLGKTGKHVGDYFLSVSLYFPLFFTSFHFSYDDLQACLIVNLPSRQSL
jgi:hypothetical protein